MLSQAQYERNERAAWNLQLTRAGKGTSAEKRENEDSWLAVLRDTKTMGLYASFLFTGDYGKGAHLAAMELLESRRNKSAQVGVWLAAVEGDMDSASARRVWGRLTGVEQAAVTTTIQAAIDEALAEMKAEEFVALGLPISGG